MNALVIALLFSAGAERAPVAVEMSFVLKVANPRVVADELVGVAVAGGGYLASRTDTTLHLKLPGPAFDQVVDVSTARGLVAGVKKSAADLAPELRQARSLLKSRKSVFDQYFAVLGTASPQAVVLVEREMTTLVQEIEALQGRIRVLEHRTRYHDVHISFQFPQRKMPLNTGTSAFQWLNTVNLVDHVEEFSRAD